MNEHETIADLIAWLRRPRDGENAYLTAWRNEIADRLAAAHKRELAVYVLAIAKLRGALVKCRDIALLWQADEAAGVAGTTDKPHARSAAEAVIDIEFEINAALFATATAEKLSAVGDAAKLREALELCVKGMCGFCRMDAEARGMTTECVNGCEALRKAKAALAAPPRNCDVGDAADWEKRFGEECDKGHICSDCPVRYAKTRMAIELDKGARCEFVWAQTPYEEGGDK